MTLTFARRIPAADLVGRLLGPDEFGGLVQVMSVTHNDNGHHGRTQAQCRPVAAAELHLMTRDEYGQWWLPLPDTAGGAA